MKFNACLLGLIIALVLALGHFCYGSSYFLESECTPNDVMNNCNSTDCMPGIDTDANGVQRCAVFWEGEEEPIPFRVCRKKTNGTFDDTCTPVNLQDPVKKVKCKDKRFKICRDTPPSGGSGCANFVLGCNCGPTSTGLGDPEANQTCTDP